MLHSLSWHLPTSFILVKMKHLFHAVAAGVAILARTVEASSLTPPVLPLVVRNPYLTVWLADARNAPWERWPMFYEGEEVRAGTSGESKSEELNSLGPS